MKAVSIIAIALASLMAGQAHSQTTYSIGQTSVAFTAGETNTVSVACPAGYFSTAVVTAFPVAPI
jgi:hypothetical protein